MSRKKKKGSRRSGRVSELKKRGRKEMELEEYKGDSE